MELINEFKVGVPVEQAWAVLTDVERIAPCLPGAQLQEVEGDEYRGIVKVKVGPITAQYKGTATFVEQDATGHRAVLRAEGRDTRGQGNASATVTATLSAADGGTAVRVVTELTITGKVAQFGRGVLADVSGKLIDQFVDNLEKDVLGAASAAPAASGALSTAGGTAGTAGTLSTAAGSGLPATPGGRAPGAAGADRPSNGSSPAGVRRIDGPEAQPIDLLATAGSPIRKRIVPLLAGLVVVVLLVRWRRRRRA